MAVVDHTHEGEVAAVRAVAS
ncbi:protein of unknown function (plasmid) [Cupriavidus taiwanensis]|uniref:Uncharacterized protein n=1 Tax=Cupriavidus taiwanensis TaxID=164546 RepID=A0A7Z7JG85_9BURK|nr:hypothetical protein CBM2585_B110042 [Cupriavidus taiwanensis]SOZ10600.1 protein of unknown function [Cupriavidus taiwanensis]SOZ12782.1 protein of unknown function [Cupriavidus taiwanensis]SOZ41274.1 protein of unknown function [Cupriavidus taiwanensis]SPC23532.1 protein of unknown function [Cupriavidus taiwanensis]